MHLLDQKDPGDPQVTSVHANVFKSSMYDLNTTAQPPTILHTSPSATTLKAKHLSRNMKVFLSTKGPGINPVSFTRSRSPDGQAAYNTCTFWTPTQEARQQPRRDLSEFSQRQASAKNFLESEYFISEQNSHSSFHLLLTSQGSDIVLLKRKLQLIYFVLCSGSRKAH